MIKIEVGKPFPSRHIRDGIFFDFKEEGFHLPIGLRNIRDDEIYAFRKGKIDIDIAFIDDIIFIIFEIDKVVMLSDVPFHIALSTTPLEALELKDGESYLLHMFLIDTSNNELKAMRLVGLSEKFSHVLKALIDKQLEGFFNMEDYERKLNNILNNMTQQDLRRVSLAHFSSKS